MMIDKQKLLDILTSEIESSTGCTDPGSVCLAVAVEFPIVKDTTPNITTPRLYGT